MKVKHLRQTGAAEAPQTLEYGCLAITKKGEIYVGNNANVPTLSTEKVTNRAENIAYDVKMLQLQEILNHSEPSMMCGFIEAFKDTNKRESFSKCTTNMSSHRLQFDGTNTATKTDTVSNLSSQGAQYGYDSYFATAKKPDEATSLSSMVFTFPTFDFGSISNLSFTVHGGASASACTNNITSNFAKEHVSGELSIYSTGSIVTYSYYKCTLTFSDAVTSFYTSTDKGTLSDASGYTNHWITASCSFTYQGTGSAADGYYVTKDMAMGANVTGGELYLHYATLPTGATIKPKVKIGSGTLVDVTAVHTGKAVSVGGVALLENKYTIPETVAGSTVSVRVDGHRVNANDTLHLYDILVAAR